MTRVSTSNDIKWSVCIAILACSFWLGDSDKTVSVLLGAKSSGFFTPWKEPWKKKAFYPNPTKCLWTKRMESSAHRSKNFELLSFATTSILCLLWSSLRLAKESFFTFFLFLLAHSQFYCVLPLFHRWEKVYYNSYTTLPWYTILIHLFLFNKELHSRKTKMMSICEIGHENFKEDLIFQLHPQKQMNDLP